jgi:dolichol-phosphate mannosyltransferase
MKKISIIVPAFNEEGNIIIFLEKLKYIFCDKYQYEIIFIDDGSTDKTLEKLKYVSKLYDWCGFISLSRNFGHQYALKAGLDSCTGDCMISLDADLQHPPELIPKLIEYWEKGIHIVYTVREESKDLGFLKRNTSKLFYKTLNLLGGINLKDGSADFRLIDKKVIDLFKENIKEYHLFIRGMIAWVGYSQIAISYKPEKRFSGVSKYSFSKMIKLALEGLTSFSVLPLRFAIYVGIFVSCLSFLYCLYILYGYLFTNDNIEGWTSLMISVLTLSGFQLISIGLLGVYIGKIFFEVKERPNYIIQEFYKPRNEKSY